MHAAALKHVNAAEYNPYEYVKTNIIGAENVTRAAMENSVKRLLLCLQTKHQIRLTYTVLQN